MAKTNKLTNEAQVTGYFNKLSHPLGNIIEALRKIILNTNKEIAEQIKWNSPAFYYTGEMKPFDPKEYKRDIVVFNLHKKEMVLLIFPTGAKINDTSGLLEGNYSDGRRMASFRTMEDVKRKKKDLESVVLAWLKAVDQ